MNNKLVNTITSNTAHPRKEEKNKSNKLLQDGKLLQCFIEKQNQSLG